VYETPVPIKENVKPVNKTPKQTKTAPTKLKLDSKVDNPPLPTVDTTRSSRQVIVFGVPVDIDKKTFKNAIRKIIKKCEIELIKEVSYSLESPIFVQVKKMSFFSFQFFVENLFSSFFFV
jgi:hypothetical protein